MKSFTLKVLFLFTLTSFSQHNKEYKPITTYLEGSQLTANLLAPGVTFEKRLIGNTSLSAGFTPGYSGLGAGGSFGYGLQSKLRWYTNMKSRKSKNKNTSGNSGNYIALSNAIFTAGVQVTGNFESNEDFTMVFNGALYGVQRTYKKKFTWNAEVGLGHYQINGFNEGTGFLINLNFGWVLTKRR